MIGQERLILNSNLFNSLYLTFQLPLAILSKSCRRPSFASISFDSISFPLLMSACFVAVVPLAGPESAALETLFLLYPTFSLSGLTWVMLAACDCLCSPVLYYLF